MALRKDIHRPSALKVEDYHFIKFDYLPSGGDILGDASFLASGRAYFRSHMEKHGGHYAENKSAGNCYICGARCIYSATFWHKPSNEYIHCGLECSDKLECGDASSFKKNVKKALEANAGKRKAAAILEKAGVAKAWALWESEAAYRKAFAAEHKAWLEANADAEPDYYGNVAGAPKYNWGGKDEMIVLDMVSKVIKYGNAPSDKALGFMKVLLDRIERAPEIAAEKAAAKAVELANSKPIPAVEGRVLIEGEVLSVKLKESFYGSVYKMLVKNADGWKVYGSAPAALIDAGLDKGDKVSFMAKVEASPDDPLFGFFSRPSKAKLVKKEEVAA